MRGLSGASAYSRGQNHKNQLKAWPVPDGMRHRPCGQGVKSNHFSRVSTCCQSSACEERRQGMTLRREEDVNGLDHNAGGIPAGN